jgi:hypothetical protein
MRGENFVAHLDGLGGTPVRRGTPVAYHWLTQCYSYGWSTYAKTGPPRKIYCIWFNYKQFLHENTQSEIFHLQTCLSK